MLKKTKTYYNTFLRLSILSLFLTMLFNGCVEPYQGSVGSYEDVLVVNALITNENKRQEVSLTHSYRFEESGPKPENNAQVTVVSSEGEEYYFEETKPGIYLSNQPFAAEMDKDYSLLITTSNGKSYASKTMQLPVNSTHIDNVYAKRMTNSDGVEGMGIFVESFDPSGQSKYYRHDYTETYKIIAPYWSPYDIVLLGEGEFVDYYNIILREQEERVCYGIKKAKSIILKNTAGLNEDRLKDYNVRFIDRDNYMLAYRYSILVRQYVQTPEAFSYYETLKGLSQTSDNIFSEDQPGFLAGNIYALDNSNENVAGYFEVATVDEKRLFFNYEDFFPDEELPPYEVGCFAFAPSSTGRIGERELSKLVKEGTVRFYDFNYNPGPFEGGFLLVSEQCGDCTTLGSNIVPDFWVD